MAKQPTSAASLFKPETPKSSKSEVIEVSVPSDSELHGLLIDYTKAHREFKAAEAVVESLKAAKDAIRKDAFSHYVKANIAGNKQKSVRFIFGPEKTPSSLRVSFTNSYKASVSATIMSGFKAVAKGFASMFKTTEQIMISQDDVPKELWSDFVKELDAAQKKFELNVIKFAASTLPVADFNEKKFEFELDEEKLLKLEELLPTPTTVVVEASTKAAES